MIKQRQIIFTQNSASAAAMKKNIEQLLKDAKAGNHYDAEIKPFNYGNDFYLLVKEIQVKVIV